MLEKMAGTTLPESESGRSRGPDGDYVVGAGRLELPRVTPHDPKSCMSANSITRPGPDSGRGAEDAYRYGAPPPARLTGGNNFGGPGRIRTYDLGIKNPLLCQLSYRSTDRSGRVSYDFRPHLSSPKSAGFAAGHLSESGAPGRIRTSDLRIRSPLLSSTELRARCNVSERRQTTAKTSEHQQRQQDDPSSGGCTVVVAAVRCRMRPFAAFCYCMGWAMGIEPTTT